MDKLTKALLEKLATHWEERKTGKHLMSEIGFSVCARDLRSVIEQIEKTPNFDFDKALGEVINAQRD